MDTQSLENKATEVPKYTRKDFLATEPRWCVGCGTYATFNAMTRVFLNSGIAREKFAVISGIGCSSRLPYYSNTYGFHTIHGRAPTVAAGVKGANPDLNVWVVTGDGDGLSIGGNHFLHMMRRNPNIKVVLFNNQIYGLTKGQTSPTSPLGTKTKSAPYGSLDRPMHPLTVALGAGATFAARVPDTDNEMLFEVLRAAQEHQGVAIVEVLINCVIFNDGVFTPLTDKNSRSETTIKLEAGKPLIFGTDNDKGIVMKSDRPEVIKIDALGPQNPDIIVHDPGNPNAGYAFMLAEMGSENLPVPFGILRQVEDHVYQYPPRQPSEDKLKRVLQGASAWVREADGSVQSLER